MAHGPSPEHNRRIVADAFEAYAEGDARPFVRLLAMDARWTVGGSRHWGRTFEGRQAIVEDLLRPLGDQMDGLVRITATSITAEGDRVVVEGQGQAATVRGEAYDNRYCFVLVMRDGRILEVREYMDSALVERVLEPPRRRPA